MEFWTNFEIVYTHIWEFLDTPMNFGGISISFWDILIASGICVVICGIVRGIMDDVG